MHFKFEHRMKPSDVCFDFHLSPKILYAQSQETRQKTIQLGDCVFKHHKNNTSMVLIFITFKTHDDYA